MPLMRSVACWATMLVTAGCGVFVAEPGPDADARLDSGGAADAGGFADASAVTADDLGRALANGHDFTTTRVQQIESLRAALARLTAARYQRAPAREASALDDTVRQLIDAARGGR